MSEVWGPSSMKTPSLPYGEFSVFVKFNVADPLRSTRVKMGLVVQ